MPFFLFSQSEKKLQKIEKFIVLNKLDSAKYHLKTLNQNPYSKLLDKIITNNNVSYNNYFEFTNKILSNKLVSFEEVSNYIITNIKDPKNKKAINVVFFNIKWINICNLRNEGNLDLASKEQKKLENYIDQFNDKDANYLWAKTKLKIHPIVMLLIENKIKEGKQLALEGVKIAKDLKDIELEIIFSYHLTDFLVAENKLQEYIEVSEKCLVLEKELPEKSMFYYSTISHLIDAYIYQGGHTERVLFLMDKLYNSSSRESTYYLYSHLSGRLSKEDPLQKEIQNKFKVNNVLELVKKLDSFSKSLNSNEYLRVIQNISSTLQTHNYYIEALEYKDKVIQLTRKIYSEELSENIANYNTEQAIKDKEEEITLEKDKTKLYTVISVLSLVLLIIMLLILIKIRRQSKELSEKNLIINDALDEKELLIKEVHHRVKNNFQVIESLLEFQSEGIEDEKAIKLFNDGKNRVKSMALIHQKLYRNQGDFIDFNDYIISLLNEISFVHQPEKEVIKVINVKNIFFDVDTAIPLGLIVNEIVTNTYKYAFKDKNDEVNKISIEIEKQKDATYKLIIEDNGIGIPEDFNIETSKSIGLKLVKRLIKQLHGTFQLIRKPGTRFVLTFKDSSIRNQIE